MSYQTTVIPVMIASPGYVQEEIDVIRKVIHDWNDINASVSTEMAPRIGKFAGNGPVVWLRMQQAYNLWYTEHRMTDQLSKIESVASDCGNA